MCGLVGIIPRKPVGLNSRELDLFEQMLVIDTIRGKDSTGVMTAERGGDAMVVKTAQEPYLLFKTKQWNSFRAKAIQSGRFVAGHNRAATRGDVTNDNAHPFVENNIILMHNGTLPYHGNLTKEKVSVDSHAIAHALAADTPEVVIPKIKGAYALIWFNTEEGKLYVTRNTERPLAIIVTDEHFLLASEQWMAAMPAQRQGRKITVIHETEPGTLYSWDMSGKLEQTELPKPAEDDTSAQEYGDWLKSRANAAGGGRYSDCGMYGDGSFTTGQAEEKTPQEIKDLRKALTDNAQNKLKSATETHSRSCALTLPSGQDSTSQEKGTESTSMTPNGSESRKTGLDMELERLEATQRSILTNNPMFKKGEELIVKLWKIDHTTNGRMKWIGKVRSPGKEMIDAQGFLPDNVLPSEFPIWLNTLCTATVAWSTHTTGGPAVFCRDTARAIFTDVHGADIPEKLWDHVVKNCGCSECSGKIEQWEKLYTHVKIRSPIVPGHGAPLNTVHVKCADCLMKVLPDGEIYDKFVTKYTSIKNAVYKARVAHRAKQEAAAASTDRDPAVQDRQSVGSEPVGKNGSTIAVPGPSTLQ